MLKKSLRLPSVRSVDDAKKLVIERDLSHVKLAVCDIDGVLRGKWVSREKFFSALDNGFGFCDIIFGWDCLDANYDNGIYTNRNSGYPDTQLRVAVETARNLPLDIDGPPFDPFHPSYSSQPPDPSDPSDPSGPSNYTGPAGPSPSYGQPRQAYDSVHSGPSSNPLSPRHFNNHSLLFLAESGEERGQDIVPRSLLKKIIAHGDSMGIAARAAAEFEFFLFRETAESVRAKHYRNLTPLTPGIFGYSLLRTGREHWFYEKLLNMSNAMDIPLEGLHTETGPGVLEAAIAATDILVAADRAALFKTFTKILAQKNGLMATFMAKWSHAYPGQSGHLHISLQNKDGRSLFFDKNKPNNMSDTMRYFIGGLQRLMPDLMPMLAPTVNSYMRITAGYWAPTSPSWGIENRTCALRVIGSSEKSLRVEHRLVAADQNPYLALAAALASGLYGIEQRLEPTAPVSGSAYEDDWCRRHPLPTSLQSATEKMKESTIARSLLGDRFVDHYTASRDFEYRQSLKAITDWQLARYFEVI